MEVTQDRVLVQKLRVGQDPAPSELLGQAASQTGISAALCLPLSSNISAQETVLQGLLALCRVFVFQFAVDSSPFDTVAAGRPCSGYLP